MIYIARHGETDCNVEKKLMGHQTIALNKKGIEQAEDMAEEVKGLKIDKIISSDLARARETAEIINRKINRPIILDARIRSINYGNLSGLMIKTISQNEWDTYYIAPETFNAESLDNAYKRIKSFFEEIKDKKDILVVTHGGALRMISYYVANRDTFLLDVYLKYFKDSKTENTALFDWENSYTQLKPFEKSKAER